MSEEKPLRIASRLRDLRRYEWKEIGYCAKDLEAQWFYHLGPRDLSVLRKQEKKGCAFIAQKRMNEGDYRLVAMLSLDGQRSRVFS